MHPRRLLSLATFAGVLLSATLAAAQEASLDDEPAAIPDAAQGAESDVPPPQPSDRPKAPAERPRPRRRADARGNELNRRIADGGMALELVVRLTAVAYAAQGCSGDACDRVAGMIPLIGPVTTAIESPEPADKARAAALATFEATSLALVALGEWDAWSDDDGGIGVGLRGPGIVIAGEF